MDTRDRIMSFVREFIADKGYSPSYVEIAEAVGLRSTSSVHFHLGVLAERGVIGYVRGTPRSIHIMDDENRSSA